MSSALRAELGGVRVELRIALSSFEVDALLLGHFLVPALLPLWQPSLRIGHFARHLRVEALGVADLSLALRRNADYHSSLCLHCVNVFGLLLLASLRHAFV